MDVSQYLEIFLDEAKEHLENLNTQILKLEQEPEDTDTINEIFRAAHSLKGMAGTMGYKRMQTLTHDMENVFSEIRNGTLKVSANMIDTLFQCLDALEEYTNNIQESADEGTNDNQPLIEMLNSFLKGSNAPAKEEKKEDPAAAEAEKKAAADGEEKWKEIVLTDDQKHVFRTAKEQGKNTYGMTVYIQENCLLKAARAFLVYKAVEERAEIIVCNPSAQDIEDEKFDLDFSLIVVTDNSLDEILHAARNVSEIDKVVGSELELKDDEASGEEETAVSTETAAERKPAQKTASAVPAKNDKKPAGKPVVNRTVRVDIEKLDVLMNLVSELIIAKNGLVSVSNQEDSKTSMQSFNEQIEYLERITTNLHESVMKVRMVPIESVVNRFPRMIRDLSKKLGKEMELIMTGEDTELDRTVIDEIGDPLMHMLRNSADHGLEPTIDRLKLGKPQVGTIQLNAYQDGNNVTIEVIDDGAGIDVEKVKETALKKGTITEEQAEMMTEKEAIDLLFRPAFSTSEKITDVSGRGVGLDVVKNKIEGLGGDVEVSTKLGEGTKFIVRLPLTLAIIQALMVEVRQEKYAIPLNSIVTIEDVATNDIKYVQQKEVINLRGTVIPLVRLDEVLDCPPRDEEPENLVVVIVKKGDKQTGLVIDNLLGQQEIVIKPLGKYINIHRMISGATILGDGEVALIIDSNALV